MSTPKNPSAFPLPIAVGPAGDVYHPYQDEDHGMTLRDYFAAHIVGHTSSQSAFPADKVTPDDFRKACEVVAKVAYSIADAMLTEREKNP